MRYEVAIERWEASFKAGVARIRDADVDSAILWLYTRSPCGRRVHLVLVPGLGFDAQACEAYRGELAEAIGNAMLAYVEAQAG